MGYIKCYLPCIFTCLYFFSPIRYIFQFFFSFFPLSYIQQSCVKYFFYNLGMKIGIVKDRVIFLVALETKPTRRNFWLKNRQNLKAMELYRSCQMGCIYSTKKKRCVGYYPRLAHLTYQLKRDRERAQYF